MTEWIIQCNLREYDVAGAFNKLHRLDWKQSTNIEKGDVVYIYNSAPESAIRYKCLVNRVEMEEPDIDDSEFVKDGKNFESYGRYMELELLEKYNTSELSREKLQANGLRSIQGPSRVTEELSSYLVTVVGQLSGQNKTRRQAITILMTAFDRPVTARELTNIMYGLDRHQSVVFSELQEMERLDLIKRSGNSAQYFFALKETRRTPHYFYVFQNQSFDEECAGEFLWAPKLAKDGSENHHWSRMEEIKKGDVILHGYMQHIAAISIAKEDCYSAHRPQELSDEWNNDGWKVDADYYLFKKPIKPKEYLEDIRDLQPDKYAPFDKNGNGNMGYLYEANKRLCVFFLEKMTGMTGTLSASYFKPVVVNKTLQLKISEFDKNVHNGEAELLEKVKAFVSDYSVQKLTGLKKEQYVYGTGSKNTFCYRVTHELYQWGSIRNGTPNKYGFYFKPNAEDNESNYRCNKVFGNTDTEVATNEAFDKVKLALFDLIVAGNNGDFKAIQDNPLSTIFKGKVLCIYYPDKYMTGILSGRCE